MEDFIRPEKPKVKKKMHLKKEVVIVVGLVVSLLIGFLLGYVFHFPKEQTTFTKQDIIDEVYSVIKNEWVNATGEDVDINEASIDGMLSGLGDPYTQYMTLEEALDLADSINGNVEGIGVSFYKMPQGAGVAEVYDGPAKEAGIQKGDLIIDAQRTNLAGLSTTEIKELITGEEGTNVDLVIQRGNKTFDLTLTRGKILTDISYEIRKENKHSFGYIKISTFGQNNTASQVETALQSFVNAKVDTLVIDLRDNAGGYLNAAKDILDLFIEDGEVLYQLQYASGPAKATNASDCKKYVFSKNYILVNKNSASASEIVAGVLQEVKGFKLVGNTTFGKGVAQTQKPLSDGSYIKYTNAKWLLPSGKCIHGEGLTPDIEVKDEKFLSTGVGEFKKTLSVDSVDSHVAQMQIALKMMGYDIDRTDGYFSKTTRDSLMKFEKDHNMEVNGIYEPDDALSLNFYGRLYLSDEKNDTQYHRLLQEIR